MAQSQNADVEPQPHRHGAAAVLRSWLVFVLLIVPTAFSVKLLCSAGGMSRLDNLCGAGFTVEIKQVFDMHLLYGCGL